MNLHQLALHQLIRLVDKNKYVNEIKIEWKSRTGLDYPFFKDMTGKQIDMTRS